MIEIGAVRQGDDVAVVSLHLGEGDALAIELAGELGDHAHQALVVAALLEATGQHADHAAVETVVSGLVETGQPEPADTALDRVKHGHVFFARQMFHLDRQYTGQARANINRLGEVVERLAVDHMRPGKTDLAAFFQRVLDGGEEILVLVQTLRPARQQMQLVVFRVRHHEHRRMHSGQQAAGGLEPFFGEAPGQAPAGLRRGRLLRGSSRHAENFPTCRRPRFGGITRAARLESLVVESGLLDLSCCQFFHEITLSACKE